MLVENILFLQKRYPILYNKMKNIEEDIEQDFVNIENTRSNHKTLNIDNNGNALYLHSKYDPIREAELIINKLEERENIDGDSHVIFYGVGLGYHIEIFSKLYPDTSFSIYEPSVEVFNKLLNTKRLDSFASKKMETIHCEYKFEVMDEFFNWIINKSDKNIIIMDLPIYKNAFSEQYSKFYERFKETIINKRISVHTNYAFQERWIMNSAINFKEVLNTPNILMQDENLFKSKMAILVAAGPSLDYEIDNLRMIKEKGLAFIFSVGSAINTLVHHDILPDAICTYDPGEHNQIVFKKINSENITNVPMIFGSSVGFEVLQQFKGPKLHMVTNQDSISNYFLKTEDDKQLITIKDAPSIAIVTLEMLYKLGFSTVILVGQNLSFSKNKRYAEGVDYQTNIDEDTKGLLKTKSVTGEEVFTSITYNSMRKSIEFYVERFKNMKVINATIDGANIVGAEFIPMDIVMEELLKYKIVQGDEFQGKLQANTYDKQYILSMINRLDENYSEYKKLLIDLKDHLGKMNKLYMNRNIKQIDKMYKKLDNIFNNIEFNDFFKVIAMPMNREQYGFLSNSVKQIKDDRDEFKKAEKIIDLFQVFIEQLYRNIKNTEDLYENFKDIRSWIEGEEYDA